MAPETIGATTTGSTNKAMNICRPGNFSMNNCAIKRPRKSSIGSAMTVNITVWNKAPQNLVSSAIAT